MLIASLDLSRSAWGSPYSEGKDTERAFLFVWPGQAPESARLNRESIIVTNRPNFTETSSTVGHGITQIELGYTYSQRTTENSREISHTYPEALLRWGVFADWLELQLGQTLISQDGSDEPSSIFDNTLVALKVGIAPRHRLLPETSLVSRLQLPLAVEKNSETFLSPEVSLNFSWLLSR